MKPCFRIKAQLIACKRRILNHEDLPIQNNRIVKKRPLSKDIINKLAQCHEGSKIYKLKVKDIANCRLKRKKCIANNLDLSQMKQFRNIKEEKLPPKIQHKSDRKMAKFAFIYYVHKKIFSDKNEKNPSLLAKNRVAKYLEPVGLEESKETEPFCVLIEQIVPKDKFCFKIESFNHPEFWLSKGYELSKEGKIEAAIDFYLQGLLSNICSNNFELMYNVACMMNQNNQLRSSIHYFSKAHLRRPLSILPVFGIAVVLYRLGEYRKSLCRNPLNDKKLHNFHRGYDKGYIFYSRLKFICLYPNLYQ